MLKVLLIPTSQLHVINEIKNILMNSVGETQSDTSLSDRKLQHDSFITVTSPIAEKLTHASGFSVRFQSRCCHFKITQKIFSQIYRIRP